MLSHGTCYTIGLNPFDPTLVSRVAAAVCFVAERRFWVQYLLDNPNGLMEAVRNNDLTKVRYDFHLSEVFTADRLE